MEKYRIEQREEALARSHGICPVCGGSIFQYGTPQFAHKIADTVTNNKKYGSFFMHSPLIGEMVCSLACNQSMNIGQNPGKVLMLLADILTYEMNHFRGEDDG